ncbi:MAG: chromosome segregation protein SMC [Rhodospirillaceae bacterium]
MDFTRLKLTGFKSFVEPTELLIEPGLTGVVGPNGCGKSNLVEALRWVMGETSAKQMRGGEMDDVIFGGTDKRPARNLAEVAIGLDNSDRSAPAQFNGANELEITRRIERGEGSQYRVNGTEFRARDIHTLFADLATGARSTALVSQGRIGALINAKPKQRRHILEEAAGITGLHSRRHEAELRLRAAETNLERLDDLLGALEEQLKTLKRQARQATRYRNLSDHIRRAEAIAIHHQWNYAKAEEKEAQKRLSDAEHIVEELTREVAIKSSDESDAASKLPGLREAEVAKAAILQRLLIEKDGLEKEEERIETEKREVENLLNQIKADIQREVALEKDADQALARLQSELASLLDSQKNEQQKLVNAEAVSQKIQSSVSELEARLAKITEVIAQKETLKASFQAQVANGEEQRQKISQRRKSVEAERDLAQEIIDNQAQIQNFDLEAAAAKTQLDEARSAFDGAISLRNTLVGREAELRQSLQKANSILDRLHAEEEALKKFLTVGNSELWPPMIDAVEVKPGYEMALAAALGDDLEAPSDEAAPIHWKTLPPMSAAPSLPEGAKPLLEFVDAPAALARRLSQIGLVENEDTGNRLAPELKTGQRLVSLNGCLWRWDGYTAADGDAGAAATRLTQRNRLEEISIEIKTASSAKAGVQTQFEQAETERQQAESHESLTKDEVRKLELSYQRIRDEEIANNQSLADARSRKNSATEKLEALRIDDTEAETAIENARQELYSLTNIQEMKDESNQIKSSLAEARSAFLDIRSAQEKLSNQAAHRQTRIREIETESQSWQTRADDARDQSQILTERLKIYQTKLTELINSPSEIAERRASLTEKVINAEQARNEAADNLLEAENLLTQISSIRKQKEALLGEGRESRVRYQASCEQCHLALEAIVERASDRIKRHPTKALEVFEHKENEKLPELQQIETRIEKLKRERENMGAVNLRADLEANELDERIGSMALEREDLLAAISRLRTGISSLNREGRERLLGAFKEVDGHFQKLFTRLFGGGKAYLTLATDEDPLEAGLEIMASPPGKKLQSMTLLSGGEQALTALSLLFAVFLTNPAPICVLDEVDAPLDDANVERFCLLIQEIAAQTGTRFLVVTHHRLTMARVDRLFGVTMGERGVSQLVSVDLQSAEKIRRTA